MDEVRLQLNAACRVGELETAAALLTRRIRLLSAELSTARERVSELEYELTATHGQRVAEQQSSSNSSSAADQLVVALRGKALLEQELASCRARLAEALQVSDTRSIELANVRSQLKDKALETKAIVARHAASLAALERERQTATVELSTAKERSKAAIAGKTKSIQDLTAALQSSQQQVAKLRQALHSGDITGVHHEASGSEISVLRQSYEVASQEAREASEEAESAFQQLEQCRALLRKKEDELLHLSEQQADRVTANKPPLQTSSVLTENIVIRPTEMREAATQASIFTSSSSAAASAASASTAAAVEVASLTSASTSSVVLTSKQQILVALHQFRQQGGTSPAAAAARGTGAFGWRSRARISRDAQQLAASADDLEEDGIFVHDISVEQLDSDDELALPSLDDQDVEEAISSEVALAVAAEAAAAASRSGDSSSLQKMQHQQQQQQQQQRQQHENGESIDFQAVTVTLSALFELATSVAARRGGGLGAQRERGGKVPPSKVEKRLMAERDNLSFERDSYRHEIMRFLEIDAAIAASSASSSSTASTPVGSPSKADRLGRTPGRVDEHAILASTLANASSALQDVHGAAQVPKRTMAIVKGFAETNARLQAQVQSLVLQLEEARALLAKARASEQSAIQDLMSAEEHNQQLKSALTVASRAAATLTTS